MNLRELIEQPRQQANLISRPYLIAEAGVNHEGNMDLAKRLINEAKEGGADAIKFQSVYSDELSIDPLPGYNYDSINQIAIGQDITMKDKITNIEGDIGAKEILKKNKDKILNLPINNLAILKNYNTLDSFNK